MRALKACRQMELLQCSHGARSGPRQPPARCRVQPSAPPTCHRYGLRGEAFTPRLKQRSAASSCPRRRSSRPHCSQVRSSRGSALAAAEYRSAERCAGDGEGRGAGVNRQRGAALPAEQAAQRSPGGRGSRARTTRHPGNEASCSRAQRSAAAHVQLARPLLKGGPLPPEARAALGPPGPLLVCGARGVLLQTRARHPGAQARKTGTSPSSRRSSMRVGRQAMPAATNQQRFRAATI